MSDHNHISTVSQPLKILKYLRLHGKCKAEELAAVIDSDERTVRRYYYSLKKVGYPIVSKTGKYGGYYLDEPVIHQAEWEVLRSALKNYPELYRKIELRLLDEFSPRD